MYAVYALWTSLAGYRAKYIQKVDSSGLIRYYVLPGDKSQVLSITLKHNICVYKKIIIHLGLPAKISLVNEFGQRDLHFRRTHEIYEFYHVWPSPV